MREMFELALNVTFTETKRGLVFYFLNVILLDMVFYFVSQAFRKGKIAI